MPARSRPTDACPAPSRPRTGPVNAGRTAPPSGEARSDGVWGVHPRGRGRTESLSAQGETMLAAKAHRSASRTRASSASPPAPAATTDAAAARSTPRSAARSSNRYRSKKSRWIARGIRSDEARIVNTTTNPQQRPLPARWTRDGGEPDGHAGDGDDERRAFRLMVEDHAEDEQARRIQSPQIQSRHRHELHDDQRKEDQHSRQLDRPVRGARHA